MSKRSPSLIAPLASLLLLAACQVATVGSDGGPTDRDQPKPPRPAPGLDAGVDLGALGATPDEASVDVAMVAGEPITTAALLTRLMHRESRLVFDTVDRLVSARLALAESERLGILLDPGTVDASMTTAVSALEAGIGLSGTGLDRWLMENLGLDPTRYFQVLRDEVVEELLAERAMRAFTLASERCELSVIMSDTQEQSIALRARLDAGESFADLARDHSTDPSAVDGGSLPPILRNDMAPLARLAFHTEVGSLAGPVEQQDGWLLLRIDGRPSPLVGPWSVVGSAVEADLAVTPIQDPEYWQWRAAMGRRYLIDLAPLLDLTGEPRLAE